MFRRNFPNYSAGIALNIPLRNRAAQSDYVTSELELRQSELGLQQNINQVRVDVQNAVIGLQQARARYAAAMKASTLQQQTLEADQKRLALGASTAYQVVLDEQNVASAESALVQALANYSHAAHWAGSWLWAARWKPIILLSMKLWRGPFPGRRNCRPHCRRTCIHDV